jgi:Cdc6-like AAA superfamily ATPase
MQITDCPLHDTPAAGNRLAERVSSEVYKQDCMAVLAAVTEHGDTTQYGDDGDEDLRYNRHQHCNGEQQIIFDAIQAQHSGLCILSGPPGSGKTWLIKKLIYSFRQSKKKVMVTATTGIAAGRLDKYASTVYNAFAIPPEGDYIPALSVSSLRCQNIRSSDVIIMDEMSMITLHAFQRILYRVSQCTGADGISEVVKNKLIILVGDMHQVSFYSQMLLTIELTLDGDSSVLCVLCSYHRCAIAGMLQTTASA